ncbi:MAG: hypothetical protein AAGA76_09255 [Pseudomonadota bacterium]
MKRLVFLVILGVFLSACSGGESVTRNIRVIAKAEVDGKVVEGSAVMGLRWKAGGQGRMYVRSRTEAVILELGGRGTVYILDGFYGSDDRVTKGYWPTLVQETLGILRTVRVTDFPLIEAASGYYPVVPKRIGTPPTLPLMVTYTDETRMETMKRVKPKDFRRRFGSDVKFLGLWFEFTDDAPTTKIPERLPIAVKVNESYYTAFPNRDSRGKLLPTRKKAFPYKVGKSAFMKRTF